MSCVIKNYSAHHVPTTKWNIVFLLIIIKIDGSIFMLVKYKYKIMIIAFCVELRKCKRTLLTKQLYLKVQGS